MKGDYILEYKATNWAENSLSHWYISPSALQTYPPCGWAFLVTCDGTHFQNEFGGTAFLWVYRDVDKKLSILSFGAAPSENGEESAWMLHQFRNSFPSLAILLQDEGVGLNSHEALEELKGLKEGLCSIADAKGVEAVAEVFVALCARHGKTGVQKRHKGKGASNLLYQLARARTATEIESVLKLASDLSAPLHDELADKVEQYSISSRLDKGLPSRGAIVQSNSESMNNAIQQARQSGHLGFIKKVDTTSLTLSFTDIYTCFSDN